MTSREEKNAYAPNCYPCHELISAKRTIPVALFYRGETACVDPRTFYDAINFFALNCMNIKQTMKILMLVIRIVPKDNINITAPKKRNFASPILVTTVMRQLWGSCDALGQTQMACCGRVCEAAMRLPCPFYLWDLSSRHWFASRRQ